MPAAGETGMSEFGPAITVRLGCRLGTGAEGSVASAQQLEQPQLSGPTK